MIAMNRYARETACDAAPLPLAMAAELDGYIWARDNVGESGCGVYRLHGKSGAPDLYLKHGKDAFANDVTAEMCRLSWLANYMPVPAIRQFYRTSNQAWLLTTALSGKTAYQVLEGNLGARSAVVDALASFLTRLHAIPTWECPFNSDHALRLYNARRRIDLGLVDVDDFDHGRLGWSTEQVWDAMQSHLPFDPDLVVTHGDFSLDNLILAEGEVVGCIDVGRLGIADRYQDLAILWNCLGEFETSLQQRFFEKYGPVDPSQSKLQFHLLLDELV